MVLKFKKDDFGGIVQEFMIMGRAKKYSDSLWTAI
jgi:hypothetical protein